MAGSMFTKSIASRVDQLARVASCYELRCSTSTEYPPRTLPTACGLMLAHRPVSSDLVRFPSYPSATFSLEFQCRYRRDNGPSGIPRNFKMAIVGLNPAQRPLCSTSTSTKRSQTASSDAQRIPPSQEYKVREKGKRLASSSSSLGRDKST
uniref:Uncharacterized protein n=1 Tax=Mycena chlorophos TaxID=658473 RepID=A0ABQ0LXR5_MYCCL|nr:predicted protein [Mycena chlorophos]